jgi:hypothetical protein
MSLTTVYSIVIAIAIAIAIAIEFVAVDTAQNRPAVVPGLFLPTQ